MKIVVKVKLLPDAATAESLTRTLTLCNEVATEVAVAALGPGATTYRLLQARHYLTVKQRGLAAQPAIHVIKKIADAYKTRKCNADNGRYGRKNSSRYQRIMSKPVTFRPEAAQAFDDRCLSWQHDARTVSIWTVDGRLRGIPFTGNPAQLEFLKEHRQGETDLQVDDRGNWFLVAICDVPDVPETVPDEWLGVDLGIAVVASVADEHGNHVTEWSGGAVTERRKKNKQLRWTLQKKGTKSAQRLHRKRAGKESRFITDNNHQISKQIVAEAQRTGCGIALEELRGIRERGRLNKPQRAMLGSWAFAQLRDFVTYKAALAGVPVVIIDARYTSQTCSACGHCAEANRPTQERFECVSCRVSLNADHNAAVNIARRGRTTYELVGSVNTPHAA